MPENSTFAKRFFSIVGILLIVAAAVLLSPSFRRWRQNAEIKKQLEASGGGANNVTIGENDPNAVEVHGAGTVKRGNQ